jgi:hypothetical protein
MTDRAKPKAKKSPMKKDRPAQVEQEHAKQQEELLNGINERDVEIEHLKTTMIALDEKVKVMDDVKDDISNTRRDLGESEVKRGEL